MISLSRIYLIKVNKLQAFFWFSRKR